jgi:hypothetical protein
MKARDWLITQGLAKAGRGKLSKAAHAALQKAVADGKTFEDYKDGKVIRANDNPSSSAKRKRNRKSVVVGGAERVDSDVHAGTHGQRKESHESFSLPAQTVNHDQSTVYGIDRNGRSALLIAFGDCAKCMRAVRYCIHNVPQLPEWIGGGDALMTKPVVYN